MNIGLANIWRILAGQNSITPAKAPVCDKKSKTYLAPTNTLAGQLNRDDFLSLAVPLDFYWRRLYFGIVSLDTDSGVGASFVSGALEFTYQNQVVCTLEYSKYFTPAAVNTAAQTMNPPCRLLWQQATPSGVQLQDCYDTQFENGLVCLANNVDGDMRFLVEVAPMAICVACDGIRFRLNRVNPNVALGADNGLFFTLGCYSQNLPL